MHIDTSSEFGARAARHLEQDLIVWLTTVGSDGVPQPSPVWFHWDGETVLMFSQPGTPKLRNIGMNPNVSLNFAGDGYGGDIVILNAEAAVDESMPPATDDPDYLAKYADGMQRIGMTPEDFAQAYSVPVRIRPTRLRGH